MFQDVVEGKNKGSDILLVKFTYYLVLKKLNKEKATFRYFSRLSGHRTSVLEDFWRWSFS